MGVKGGIIAGLIEGGTSDERPGKSEIILINFSFLN